MIKTARQHRKDQTTSQYRKLVEATSLGLIMILYGIGSAQAEQAVTGKIVIDGVVYGNGNMQIPRGSGDFAKEKRKLATFDSVKILGGVDVKYRRDSAQRVEISGDQNLLALIKTQVSRGVLTVGSSTSYQTRLPLTVELSSPSLKLLSMQGAGDIVMQDLDEDKLKLELNGSGEVKATGQVGLLAVDVTGASDVNAKKLVAERADIRLTGSGDLELTVRDSLSVQILGSGDVTYYGHPAKIEKRIIGSGDIQSGD